MRLDVFELDFEFKASFSKSYSYILTKLLSVCVFVCPPPVERPKAQKLANGLKTGLKTPKLGQRPSLGVFVPHTYQEYAGHRPELIESIIFVNLGVLGFF